MSGGLPFDCFCASGEVGSNVAIWRHFFAEVVVAVSAVRTQIL